MKYGEVWTQQNKSYFYVAHKLHTIIEWNGNFTIMTYHRSITNKGNL